jgi:hypothetical protein
LQGQRAGAAGAFEDDGAGVEAGRAQGERIAALDGDGAGEVGGAADSLEVVGAKAGDGGRAGAGDGAGNGRVGDGTTGYAQAVDGYSAQAAAGDSCAIESATGSYVTAVIYFQLRSTVDLEVEEISSTAGTASRFIETEVGAAIGNDVTTNDG